MRYCIVKNRIILSADGTCDLVPELKEKYDVHFFNYHIQIGEKSYVDHIEISPDDIYRSWREKGILPKTAAVTPGEYSAYFAQWVRDGYEVIHFNLGSSLSSSYQNCCIAAGDLGHIYPIDSANLSTGIALLICKAAEMIAKGLGAQEIKDRILAMREKSHASFVLDTLEFMRAGGRCSAVTLFGANLLKIKPEIVVDNKNGAAMNVGKKYRGSMEKVLCDYVGDKLRDRDDLDTDRMFITHSGVPDSDIELVRAEIKKYADFKETYIALASGTISSHCGPRTLGIIFMTK